MSMAVFRVPSSNAAGINVLTSDDTVSRQSIHTRDAKALGLKGDFLYLRIQGSDAGVDQAKKLAFQNKVGDLLPPEEAATVSEAIDAEEDAAAEGMGMIFGG